MTKWQGQKYRELQGDLSLEDEVGRSCERDFAEARVLVSFKTDPQRVTAQNIDFDGSGNPLQQVVNDGAGHHAGATGQSLILDSSFIGSDRNVSWFELLNEVGIGAVGKVTVVADG